MERFNIQSSGSTDVPCIVQLRTTLKEKKSKDFNETKRYPYRRYSKQQDNTYEFSLKTEVTLQLLQNVRWLVVNDSHSVTPEYFIVCQVRSEKMSQHSGHGRQTQQSLVAPLWLYAGSQLQQLQCHLTPDLADPRPPPQRPSTFL